MFLVSTILNRRPIGFAAVGASGVVVHLAILGVFFDVAKAPFIVAQAFAVVIAMTTNFLLNNELTYRRHRLRGGALAKGWLSFCGVSALGALMNSVVTVALHALGVAWWLAPLAGVVAAMAWNYRATAALTWRVRPRMAG